MVKRTRLFISYSHEDIVWLKRLQVHLRPLEREGVIELWDDTRIQTGAKWHEDIRHALASARIAVLLVSANFLASDFILTEELPPLLTAAEADGVRILPLIIGSCRFTNTPLAQFQSVNSPSLPLNSLRKSEWEALLVRVADAVSEALNVTIDNEIQKFPCNLPRQDTKFIGRKREQQQLLTFLSPSYRSHIVSVDGIGGVGKTALVVEVAYSCLEASTSKDVSASIPQFDAIIFTTAKRKQLLQDGEFPVSPRQSTLKDIYQTIAATLDDQSINQSTPDEQLNRVYESLKRQNTLLIVDNIEEVIDKRPVLEFIANLPSPTKAVITSRERLVDWAVIHLDSLPQKHSKLLLRDQAKEKGVILGQDEVLAIYNYFGGIPLALIYAVGQMASGYSLDWILSQFPQLQRNGRPSDIASFCFETSVRPLRGKPAHKLLMAIVMFRHAPTREAVVHVSGLRSQFQGMGQIDEGFECLVRLSLGRWETGRFRMLTITRRYAFGELEENPDFRDMARERWIDWYMSLAKRNGGKDLGEWHIKYDRIDQEWGNLLSVLDWCAAESRYELVKGLWDCLNDFASLNGYWEDRLFWTQWTITESQRLGDWMTMVKAMSNRSWTLTQIGGPSELKEARGLLNNACSTLNTSISERNVRLVLKDGLAKHSAYLCISNENYKAARRWLRKERIYVNMLDRNSDSGDERWTRSRINISYYLAEIDFLEGNYTRAQKRFEGILKRAIKVDWLRRANYARHWLAEIAISQRRYQAATELLEKGLKVAIENKEKRRIAEYQWSFSRLERARENVRKAEQWRRIAVESCKHLGMGNDAPHIRHWLDS